MTVTVTKRWVVPNSNLGTLDDPRQRSYHLQVSGVSDSTTNLTDEVLVNLSTLSLPDGSPVGRLAIRSLGWVEDGFTYLTLKFDRSPDDTIVTMAGADFKDYPGYLTDVGESGDGTGNLLLTTSGAASGSTFNIDVVFKAKAVLAPSAVYDPA